MSVSAPFSGEPAGAAADHARRPRRRGPRTSPPSRRVRGFAVPLVAAGVLLSTTACLTGNSAATQQPYQPAAGVDASNSTVEARNLLIVSSGDGGTFVGSFANQQPSPDTLESISIDGTPAALTLTNRTIAPVTLLTFGTAGGPQAVVPGPFTAGTLVPVRITFASSAALSVLVPVYPRFDYLTGVPTAPGTVPAVSPTTTLNVRPVSPPPSGEVISPAPPSAAEVPPMSAAATPTG